VSDPTPDRPARRAVQPSELPRTVLLAFAVGAALLIAALEFLVLRLVGVDRIDPWGFLVVVVVAAVGGGFLTRVLVPRIPVRGGSDTPPG